MLIVDDHPSFRASARRMLEASGYAVVGEAADGAAAVAAVRDLRPDLVLLDVRLPDLDGFEVAARLAELGGGAVVLTSSRDAAEYGDAVGASLDLAAWTVSVQGVPGRKIRSWPSSGPVRRA